MLLAAARSEESREDTEGEYKTCRPAFWRARHSGPLNLAGRSPCKILGAERPFST